MPTTLPTSPSHTNREKELVTAIAKNFEIQAPTPGGTGKSIQAFMTLGINGAIYSHALDKLNYPRCELDESFFILIETLEEICKQYPTSYGSAYSLTVNHFSPRGIITSESDAAILKPMIDDHIERMNEAIIEAIDKTPRGENDIQQLARLRECGYPGFQVVKEAVLAKIPEDVEGTKLKTLINTTFL